VVGALATLLLPLRPVQRWSLAGLILAAGVGAALVAPAPTPPVDVTPADRTVQADSDWASSRTCRSCHPDAYDTWHHSYHRTMTQRATPESVVAPWQGTLTASGMQWTLIREGDAFFVEAPAIGTDGTTTGDRERLPVVMTTGSHHMQLYWLPLPWAEQEPTPAGREAFETHCASCHRDGDAPRLVEAGLLPPQLGAGLRHRSHPTLELDEGARSRALTYLARVQIRGRLQQLPFAWFIREQRWVHEEDTFLQPPEDLPGHADWEQTWSEACDQCHSVGPQASWTPDGAPTQAAVAELGIACEACHGPARAHAQAMRDPASRYAARLGLSEAPDIVNPGALSPDRSIAVCAQCHGELVRNAAHGTPFPVGETLEPWARVVPYVQGPPYPDWLQDTVDDDPLLMASAFWRDGTMRVAGRDANGLLASACATRGELTCITCHDLHGGSRDDQLREGMRGDAACVDCHPVQAEQGSAHTHHAPDSSGSECMNCHMPHTTLGLLTAMRAHRIDSPSALRTHQTGRPDACTLCHLDKPLSWTAEHLADWYDHPVPPIGGDARSTAVDRLLRGDAAQRAVYAWHLGWAPALQASGRDWVPGVLAQALDDPYSAVRAIAIASLRRHPGYQDLEYDFTAPPAERQAVIERVIQQWEGGDLPARPEVLVGPDGLDRDLVRLLQSVRDDRPVVVSE